jgi:hypothetical protein
MNTEIYAVGLLVFCIVAIIFATIRWPEFFKNDDKDPPVYPMM